MPPIETETPQIEQPAPSEPKEDKYDDFDDDMEFIEEEPAPTQPEESTVEQTINSNVENTNVFIPKETINNFKDVLEEIRNCSKKIEDSGFEIETEEIDLNGEYQVIFKIKNN